MTKSIAQQIFEYRKRYGYSQVDIARIIGVNRRTIIRIEKRQESPSKIFIKILKMEGII